jgi:hypothetical protein
MAGDTRPAHMHAEKDPYHSEAFRMVYGGLPEGSNSLFTGSGKCAGCHAADPNHFAGIAGQTFPATPMPGGWDVNPTDAWRSSIMANSAKDPFWRAKVSHEVALNPSHQLLLEDKCTSCHAPLGHFAAHHDGMAHYSLADLVGDSLGLDGVSCNACHQQSPVGIGTRFSGELTFTEDTLYGPYGGGKSEPPIYNLPMNTYVGYEPVYGAHIAKSETCAGCHTLVTQTVDLAGIPTGADFVEQATYHEWLNSRYAPDLWQGVTNALQQECQGCHMKRIDDPVIISSGYSFLEPRSPYGLHDMVGANAAMLRIMRDHTEILGLNATPAQFDSTLSKTLNMLQQETLDMEVEAAFDAGTGTMSVDVSLVNKAGHKFPSGYPARRAWVELKVTHPVTGEVVWHSGGLAADGYSIETVDGAGLSTWEPHYDVITSEQEVQIYEMVIADVNGSPTNVLERAAFSLKDNRLLPLGFSVNHPTYDTVSVVGASVLQDMATGDFNRSATGNTGTGSDVVHYLFDVPQALAGNWVPEVTARVWYQSMPPRWVAPMFEVNTPEIEAFEAMFWDYAAPDLVASVTTDAVVTSVAQREPWAAAVFPNPTSDGRVNIQLPADAAFVIFEVISPQGDRVRSGRVPSSGRWSIELPGIPGTYLLRLTESSGKYHVQKLIRR